MHINGVDIREWDRRAVALSADVARGVRQADLDRPTPCAGWTVADLLAHMTAHHRGFARAVAGPTSLADWELPTGSSATTIVADYLQACAGVTAAFDSTAGPQEAGEEGSIIVPPISPALEFPTSQAISFHVIDYLVHGWDLARGIGAHYRPGADLLAAALPIAEAVPQGQAREVPGAAFRAAVPLDGDAPTIDRIIAVLGRSPGWTAELAANY